MESLRNPKVFKLDLSKNDEFLEASYIKLLRFERREEEKPRQVLSRSRVAGLSFTITTRLCVLVY